jgi:hypothetical protein
MSLVEDDASPTMSLYRIDANAKTTLSPQLPLYCVWGEKATVAGRPGLASRRESAQPLRRVRADSLVANRDCARSMTRCGRWRNCDPPSSEPVCLAGEDEASSDFVCVLLPDIPRQQPRPPVTCPARGRSGLAGRPRRGRRIARLKIALIPTTPAARRSQDQGLAGRGRGGCSSQAAGTPTFDASWGTFSLAVPRRVGAARGSSSRPLPQKEETSKCPHPCGKATGGCPTHSA